MAGRNYKFVIHTPVALTLSTLFDLKKEIKKVVIKTLIEKGLSGFLYPSPEDNIEVELQGLSIKDRLKVQEYKENMKRIESKIEKLSPPKGKKV